MIKVLSIGNSFSTDAQRYLHKVALNEGVEMRCVNLFIGGCSLYTHYINMLEDNKAYDLEVNGEGTGFKVSMKEALINCPWDYITIQQVSSASFRYDSYFPYIAKLVEYVKLYSPKAKIMLHQTWAYDSASPRYESLNLGNPHKMLDGIVDTCKRVAEEINAYGIIPCGEAMMKAMDKGLIMNRDCHHASYGLGRYLLALTWLKTLTGKTAEKEFCEFDEPVSSEDAKLMRDIAEKILS